MLDVALEMDVVGIVVGLGGNCFGFGDGCTQSLAAGNGFGHGIS